MAFDLQEEDYEFNETFGAFSDDEDEAYEEESEFDLYTDEEADARWGSLSFIQLVNELDNTLANSRKFFFSKKKRIVDAELAVNLAKTISAKMPGEFEYAESIIADRDLIISDARSDANAMKSDADTYYTNKKNEADALAERIIADAQKKAENIIADAQAQANELVATHTITARARELSKQIIAEAQGQAANIVSGTEANCQRYIEQLTAWGNENIKGVTDFANAVIGSSIELSKKNMDELTNIGIKFNNAAESKKEVLSRPPRMGTKQQPTEE